MGNRDELISLSVPIGEWLQKNCDPHVMVVIDTSGVRLIEDTVFMRFDPQPVGD